MATRDLERLAKRVKAHRMELYSSRDAAASAAGMTKDTWQRVEEGRPARESSYARVDKALGWAAGSCVLIAEGGEPVLGDDSQRPAGAAQRPTEEGVRKAAFEAATAKLPTAPIGDVQAFVDELVNVLRRAGEVEDGS